MLVGCVECAPNILFSFSNVGFALALVFVLGWKFFIPALMAQPGRVNKQHESRVARLSLPGGGGGRGTNDKEDTKTGQSRAFLSRRWRRSDVIVPETAHRHHSSIVVDRCSGCSGGSVHA